MVCWWHGILAVAAQEVQPKPTVRTQRTRRTLRDRKREEEKQAVKLPLICILLSLSLFLSWRPWRFVPYFFGAACGGDLAAMDRPGEALNDFTRLPSETFQIRISPSKPPDAIKLPSGLMATA